MANCLLCHQTNKMRVKSIFAVLLLMSMSAMAQVKSPDEFLGYSLGSKFTPHYKIVNYFNQTAAAMPQQMKLEKYGETNEGRELLLAQASDWTFLVGGGTARDYADRKIRLHLARFEDLHDRVRRGAVEQAELAALEAVDNFFPHLDYRAWAPATG